MAIHRLSQSMKEKEERVQSTATNNAMVWIPLGYRFMPTNEEVIKYYLLGRAMGLPVPATHHIVERQLYGENADPRHVLGEVDDSHWDILQNEGSNSKSKDDRVIYVLTKLTKTGKRVARRAGKGTWSGQTGGKDIVDSGSGQLIGTLKMFSYEADPTAAGERNDGGVHWIMHEYSLAGNNNITNHDVKKKQNEEEFVICKIRRTSKRKEFCGQHDHEPSPSNFKKQKLVVDHHPSPIPVLINNNNSQQMDLVFAPTTPHVLAADLQEESNCYNNYNNNYYNNNNNNSNYASVVVGVDEKTQPAAWAAEHHDVINLDDDDDDDVGVACPNVVVGDDGVNKLLGGSTPADTHEHDVINLDDDDDDDDVPSTTGPDVVNRNEEGTHDDMVGPSSNHNVVVVAGVEEEDEGALAVSALVDSLPLANNHLLSMDDVEEPGLSENLELELNLDDLDLYFTDVFVA